MCVFIAKNHFWIISIQIDVSDSLSGSITLEVQLEMPATPPTFDKDEYVMEVKENHPESDDIGNFTVGDINENKCLGN